MGDVGYRVVELLERLGETVVVITERVEEERLERARKLGVEVHLGDARSDLRLEEARIREAGLLIAATDRDLVNIEIALDARRLHPGLPVVVRLFDPTLAHQLEGSLEVRRALGLPTLAAPSFTAAALGDSILASLAAGNGLYVIGRQLMDAPPLAGAATVGEVSRRHPLLCLARQRPGEELAALPPGDLPLAPGDRLSLLGAKSDWEALFGPREAARPAARKTWLRHRLLPLLGRWRAIWREEPRPIRAVFLALCLLIPGTVLFCHFFLGLPLSDAIFVIIANLHGEIPLAEKGVRLGIKLVEVLLMVLGSLTLATVYSMLTDYLVGSRLRRLLGSQPMPESHHVVVVGLGDVGFRVVDELVALGVPVVAVDADPDGTFLATVRAKAPLLVGDARLADTLAKAGLAKARAVVAVTGDDSVNLGIGLAARRLNPKVRTVVRLFDPDLARKVERTLGIDAALGASRIAAPTFVAAALYSDVVKAFVVEDRLFVLRQRTAEAEWAGATPATLRAEHGVHVLLRNGERQAGGAADDKAALRPEDELLVASWRKLAPAWSARA